MAPHTTKPGAGDAGPRTGNLKSLEGSRPNKTARVSQGRRHWSLDQIHAALGHVGRDRDGLPPDSPRLRNGWQGRKSNSGMALAWFAWERGHTRPACIDRISWRHPKRRTVMSRKATTRLNESGPDTVVDGAEAGGLRVVVPSQDDSKPNDVEASPGQATDIHANGGAPSGPSTPHLVSDEDLDDDEREFRQLRRDLPGANGSSAAGIVTIGVAKLPPKNEFFRTHPGFTATVNMVDLEVGMEKTFFAVSDPMVEALAGIGITVSLHDLYLTTTPYGTIRIVPVRRPGADGEMSEWHRTKQIALVAGIHKWVRLYTDMENKAYRVFEAPVGRFAEPIWPELKSAKIFRLGFRDKGKLINSIEHPLFQRWAARDTAAK
jgi:hypothetical protein